MQVRKEGMAPRDSTYFFPLFCIDPDQETAARLGVSEPQDS